MTQKLKEFETSGNEAPVQFLSEENIIKLEVADANPFIKISSPDKSIPFIVTSDGGVIADITVNNPKTIVKNLQSALPADELSGGAGFIDVFYGNQLLVFRHITSKFFEKSWQVDDIVSALQSELNLYYPGYQIRSC